ncbi:MAG: ABC transporter substrate-binding protein [Tissierellia bacterium]|nr:ABC transporter substrate-binding protein [Tissierellia bacterium]
MKKIKLLGIVIAVLIMMAACNQADEGKNDESSGDAKFKIGINQLVEHKALDDSREGFIEGLKSEGVEAEIIAENAQGETAAAGTIAEKLVGDKVDLILAIATPAAQATQRVATETPVLFTAVTDPAEAGIVESNEAPEANVTGTSDKADVKSQLEMFHEIDPDIKTIGLIYNTSEANSETQIAEVEEIAPQIGLETEKVGVNNINDIPQAIQTLISKVDAVYLISDNMVADSIEVIAEAMKEKKMISIASEESMVSGGALMTNGLSYYELGKLTAKMAKEILVDGKKPSELPVRYLDEKITKLNEGTLKALGLDKNLEIFKDATIVD